LQLEHHDEAEQNAAALAHRTVLLQLDQLGFNMIELFLSAALAFYNLEGASREPFLASRKPAFPFGAVAFRRSPSAHLRFMLYRLFSNGRRMDVVLSA
jgi:hypothetical protein